MSEIIKNKLYLGDMFDANNETFIKNNKISCIICVAEKVKINNTDSNILPLFGRPTFNGSNKWNYYTSSDKFQNFKLPISIDGRKCDDDLGCNELRDGDMISIPSYNGKFRVEIYNYDKPRYIPFVY